MKGHRYACAGYIDALLIPASATSIRIREETASNNHLGTFDSLECEMSALYDVIRLFPACSVYYVSSCTFYVCCTCKLFCWMSLFVALRTVSGEHVLNGNYVIDVTGRRDVAGMTFEYTRTDDGAEQLTAAGPVTQPLMVMVGACVLLPLPVFEHAYRGLYIC